MPDMVVRYRPLWSFFILGTEKWLGAQSAAGLHLASLDFRGRFRFGRGEPRPYRYCFSFARLDTARGLHARLSEHGWEELGRRGRWRLYRSAGGAGPLPNRRGLYLRNNSLLYFYAFASSLALLVGFALAFGLFWLSTRGAGENDRFFRGSAAVVGAFAALLLANFASFMHLSVGNNRILEEPALAARPERDYRQFLKSKTFEGWLEKLLIREGDIVARFYPLWFFLPRGLEKWLSRMEERGCNVYKVHKSGLLFYFTRSAPRAVCFCVVNCEGADTARALAAGWRVVYSSPDAGPTALLGRTVILARPRDGGAPCLPFGTRREYLANAIRLTLRGVATLSVLFVLSIVLLAAFLFAGAARGAVLAAGVLMALLGLFMLRVVGSLAYSRLLARRLYP